MARHGSRFLYAGIVGCLAIVPCQSLQARQFAVEGEAADVVARAIAPIVGVAIRACTQQPVSGRADIRTLADAAEFFGRAGVPVSFVGTELAVGCDQADRALPPGISAANVPQGSPLNPFGQGGSFYPQSPVNQYVPAAPVAPPERPAAVTMSAKWVKRPLLEKVAGALGVKLIFDDTPDHPILISGPADAVSDARRYIDSVNVCPVGLTMEASVIQNADSDLRSSEAGARIGTKSIGFGTAGTADTGLSFSWLSAFLDARKEVARFKVNASHTALLLPGEPTQLRDGGEAPVRAATSVTDRETRTDVVYRATGFNLDLTLQAIDGDDALLSVEQSYSSVGAQTELGPAFNNRSFKSVVRVPIGQPSVLTVSGADTVSDNKRRGLLFWGKSTTISKTGSFLVFKLARSGCREREPATATGSPKPRQLGAGKKDRVVDDGA